MDGLTSIFSSIRLVLLSVHSGFLEFAGLKNSMSLLDNVWIRQQRYGTVINQLNKR